MYSVFIKELSSFFSSIVGYVAVLAFLAFCGFFLWVAPDTSILSYGYAGMDMFFQVAPYMLMLLIPAITMRSFADENKSGTIEWLSTKPLTSLEIILGKYLATVALILFALLPTLMYVYSISDLAAIEDSVDSGAIIGSYIGLFLLASCFAAIGIFCSSLTNNQIVGFLLALLMCYLLYAGFQSLANIPAFRAGLDYYLVLLGMSYHYDAVSRGFLDTRDLVYFLSVIFLFIALTRYALNRRTWDTAKRIHSPAAA